jgi:hypothetical protein
MELEPGEVICNQCNGETFTRYTEQRGKGFYPMKKTCDKCNGHGKLDWIENITGIQKSAAYETVPDLHKYASWEFIGMDDDNPPYKRSSEEIKQRINPNYQKQLHRKIAYNSQRR